MKRIKYFAFYDYIDSTDDRNIVLSAVNKIDYVISCLNAIGYGVDMVSFAGVKGTRWRFLNSCIKAKGDNTLRLFASLAAPKVFQPLFRLLFTLNFVMWILWHCHNGEQIIVYHSLGYAKIFNFIRRIKKLRIVGEIEEIYQDVANNFSNSEKKAEYEFINGCTKYILPSRILDEKINPNSKPVVIVHGTYKVAEHYSDKSTDGKIHVVYAGTFDPNKGGAQISLAAAKYLDSDYHLHLIGFGSEEDLLNIKEKIDEMSGKIEATVSYNGLLKGEEFERFLQYCHIGLSTQDPEDMFNETSFPSKVLTYMANGLKVVSFRINVLTTSLLSKSIYYPDSFDPKVLAECIMKVNRSELQDMDILKRLDSVFKKELKILLSI